jgi:thiol-disulfide isomerase/thioredoxin
MRKWLAALMLLLPVAAAAAELQPFTRGSWQALREAHAGRATVVHLWGLTCAPCLAELPRWGELLRERPDINLVLIAADQLGTEERRIDAMLAKSGLSAPESWGFADRFAARLRYEIDPRWQGELPRTLLIAADGGIVTLPGVAELDTVRGWLAEQDAKRAAAQ